jgi:Protein of unknown function (DUF2397)
MAHGQGEPQPFTHMGVPNSDLCRSLLRTFARAKERFIVHLRPEDVAAELRIEADEQLTQAPDQLVVWGILRADIDTSRVTTVEDFHRKRSLYQLTATGRPSRRSRSRGGYRATRAAPVGCAGRHRRPAPLAETPRRRPRSRPGQDPSAAAVHRGAVFLPG